MPYFDGIPMATEKISSTKKYVSIVIICVLSSKAFQDLKMKIAGIAPIVVQLKHL